LGLAGKKLYISLKNVTEVHDCFSDIPEDSERKKRLGTGKIIPKRGGSGRWRYFKHGLALPTEMEATIKKGGRQQRWRMPSRRRPSTEMEATSKKEGPKQ
jgi:hypothetical protein